MKTFDQSEARAERRGQEPEPRRGADEREALEPHRQRLRVGAIGDAHVDAKFLHRRIEEFLERRPQPMDFVDEEDVARFQRREHPDEIPGALEHGS